MTDPSTDRCRRRATRGGRRASGSSCRPTTRPRTSARSRRAILAALPAATLLVVDDGSPDGTGRAGRRAGRRRPADPGPPSRRSSRASAARTSTASASRWRAAPRPSSRWTPTSATTRRALPGLVGPVARGDGRPRHRLALHEGRRRRRLGARPPGRLARRQPVRPDRARSPAERPDRRLQGVAGDDPGGRPVRRRPRRRLRLPDRDDVPGRRAGARIREVPITFRDRRVGQSKMCRRIVVEALVVVVQLRAEELRGRLCGVARGLTDRDASAPARRLGDASPRTAARRPGRARRAAAPGARPRAADGAPISRACSAPTTRIRSTGESFAFLLAAPTSTIRPTRSRHLDVVGRRLLPPTRLLRSGGA